MQKKIAYIFPGQGAQYVGMGKDLYERSPAAKKIFDKADECVGFSLSQICFSGSVEQLKSTDICQPAILAVSIAALEAFKEYLSAKCGKQEGILMPAFCAGLSLGEYSALVSAGILSFEEALEIVRKRGQFMEEAAKESQGGMIAVIGLDETKMREAVSENGLYVANLNCPGQVVISGNSQNLEKAGQKFLALGALKVIPLEVNGAFHSLLMRRACERLEAELANYTINPTGIEVVFNATAASACSALEIKKNLVNQVSSTVLWQDSIEMILKSDVSIFIEIGPGKVLRGLLRRIDSSAVSYNIENFQDMENVADKLMTNCCQV